MTTPAAASAHSDSLLVEIGFDSPDNEFIVAPSARQTVRRLATIHLEFSEHCRVSGKEINSSTDMLKRNNFNELSNAIRKVSTCLEDSLLSLPLSDHGQGLICHAKCLIKHRD